ncbi:hypothetical protein ACHAXT_004686 [Thalassiosira profunda]
MVPEESCDAMELPPKVMHPNDSTMWLYHVESTTSTMDEAKRIVESKFADGGGAADGDTPSSFLISATSQSNGRGTTKRKWTSNLKGNALFTVGIQQSAWMEGLKSQNDGLMVPLTLLPLKVGSLVASHVQRALEGCSAKTDAIQIPRATVKWPNDVLLRSAPSSHEKIAGILIESSQEWFLIGIGVNVGYAPGIPTEGADYGRTATSLSQYCNPATTDVEEEEHWIKLSRQLAVDVAYDLHSWLHPSLSSPASAVNFHSGEAILDQWKSYLDWDMELTLRDTPKRERVTLKGVLEDGRVVVQEVETGQSRTLVADYFL